MRKVRTGERRRRRLKVKLGNAASFTTDLSKGGFSTETMRVLPAGTVVTGAIEALGKNVPFSGRVAWSTSGDPILNVRGRMGIAFERVDRDLLERLLVPTGSA